MQKKLIVVALAAAFTLPVAAHAENGNFTFYGKINVDVESVKSDLVKPATAAVPATANLSTGVVTPAIAAVAASPTSMNRLQSNASRFGFKGSADLGGDLQAIYQFETQIDSVNDKNAKTPFNGVRNSQIGIKGSFGTVFAGNWDTPFKVAHNKSELFDNTTVFSAINLIGVTGNNKSYNTRQNNVIQYWTPEMNGFKGQVSYALDSAKTATTDKTAMSLAGMYENDMLYGALAYETRADQTTTTQSDNATRLVGAFKFTNGQVGITAERHSVANTATTTASQSNIELAGTYKIENINLAASYVKNGNYNGTSNSGAKQLSLRSGYSFSKATELYAAYTSLENDSAASYGFYSGAAAGSKQTAFGLGMIHSF